MVADRRNNCLRRAQRESGLSRCRLHHRSPKLASIQFAGSVLAWGLMVPLFIFFLGPQLTRYIPADTPDNWANMADAVWRYIVRPIAVGGMLVGAAFTLSRCAPA